MNDVMAPLINIGYKKTLIIRELAELIWNVLEYKGVLEFDTTKPDGTPQNWLDRSKSNLLVWKPIGIGARLKESRTKCDEKSVMIELERTIPNQELHP
jgi:hypothetical protein